MTLNTYLQNTRLLMKDESFTMVNDFNLVRYVNQARGQIAGEAECIRNYATLSVDNTGQQYAFSAITLAAPSTGIQGVLNVRKITFSVGSGQQRVIGREWEWFQNFILGNPAPTAGQPAFWAQYGQGAAGTIFVNLLDGAYTLALDTVCYPAALTADGDTEVIPYQWTDAIPYYAAYVAYLEQQDAEKAEGMFKLYQMYMQRARAAATPSVLPHQFEQAPDMVMAGRLGIQRAQ